MAESDEEQLEALKNWWRRNGVATVLAVLLALGAVFGYRTYQSNAQQSGEAASAIYAGLADAAGAGSPGGQDEPVADADIIDGLADTLKSEYGGSTYAVFAALHLAKAAVDTGDLGQARSELEWALGRMSWSCNAEISFWSMTWSDLECVFGRAPDERLEMLIRLRLARVLVAQNDPEAAMALLLDQTPPSGQAASFEEVKGDIHLALGDPESARQSYRRALERLADDIEKPLLELKLSDIPLAGDTPPAAGET